MEVDKEAYPLDNTTKFDIYSELKSPEKVMKPKPVKDESLINNEKPATVTREHRNSLSWYTIAFFHARDSYVGECLNIKIIIIMSPLKVTPESSG
ncbi:hypothetical protein K501DRAFT_175521 [Backusella circina FSU 941]|nr:hypothetical protein K501DRAFT_175521 [Backusella circina FSU 941]